MKVETFLDAGSARLSVKEGLVTGRGKVNGREVAVIGIVENTPLGVDAALGLSEAVLEIVEHSPGQPIVVPVATKGQKMALRDELLGLNQYLSHLCRCWLIARQRGHRVVALLGGEALGGALIATGLMADTVIALPGANPMVMPLDAIAAVTKCCRETLDDLSARSPLLTPGAEAFARMGAIDVLFPEDPAKALAEALAGPAGSALERPVRGAASGGRLKAREVADRVVSLP